MSAEAVTRTRTSRGAWVAWGVSVTAYVIAVLNRTSFGVAAIDASDRFNASASDLASFAVVQLLVYAALQIPVGLLVDRLGPKTMIVAGAVLMVLGQVLLSVVGSVTPALVARVLVGAGDALTFISVLRVVADWFPGRRVPVITQLTGLLGQAGQVLSALPFAALLAARGWTFSFLGLAAVGVLVTVLVLLALRSPAHARAHRPATTMAEARRQLVRSWQHPGTRLGLYTHFTSQFSATVFVLLWGYPFLVTGEGVSRATAGTLITLNVALGVVISPLLGRLVARHPLRRSWLVLGIILAQVFGWTVVIGWPGVAPSWVLVLLMVTLAAGGPGSMIGFDFARTFNPPSRLGSANGIVNVGGFTASLLTIMTMGIVLDLLTTGRGGYSLGSYKVAFSVQYVTWGVGIVLIVLARRKVRRRLHAEAGVVVPPIRHAVRRDWDRFRARRR